MLPSHSFFFASTSSTRCTKASCTLKVPCSRSFSKPRQQLTKNEFKGALASRKHTKMARKVPGGRTPPTKSPTRINGHVLKLIASENTGGSTVVVCEMWNCFCLAQVCTSLHISNELQSLKLSIALSSVASVQIAAAQALSIPNIHRCGRLQT